MIGIGVTGTDTGIGKTIVARSIVAALRASFARVAAMKPVESGCTEDAESLWRATGMAYPMEYVGPVSLAEPLAPLVAARRANTPVDLGVIDDAFERLCADSDAIVVEGAGGLLVPITEEESYATLFRRWRLDLVIVAPNRLGTVNHTLLTVRAAREFGIRIRAVVLNTITDQQDGLPERTNLELIRELLPNIRVIPFAYTRTPDDASNISLTSLGLDDAP
ncbi:MAG: dethiobiotin synthase [Gemmatimonadota bacterium]